MLDPFVPLLLDSSYRSYPDDHSVLCKLVIVVFLPKLLGIAEWW